MNELSSNSKTLTQTASARTLTQVFAIGHNSWGKGSDSHEAIQNWAKNASLWAHRDNMTVELRAVDASAEMDPMGNLYYQRCEKLPSVTFSYARRQEIWGGAETLEEMLWPVKDAIYELADSSIEE